MASTYNNLAWVERGEGDYRAAMANFHKALGIWLLNFGESRPPVKMVLESMASTIRQGAAAGDPEMQELLKKLEAGER